MNKADYDRQLEEDDWPKRTWDLGIDNGADLDKFLAGNSSPEQFMELPVFRWNVDKLPWLKEWAQSKGYTGGA
ncbi:MAG: hypothetical protein ACR2HJ_01690 [Fimbriimonadales bacterium]